MSSFLLQISEILTRKIVAVLILISVSVSTITYMTWAELDIVYGTGTVRFLDFEGGFYGIFGDNGEHYDPVDLSDEFKVDGLRVYFVARILLGFASFHMWGQLVSIVYIQKL